MSSENQPKTEPQTPEMVELNPPEQTRTYHYANGVTFVVKDVTHFASRSSGTHRLKTKDGHLWAIPAGFLAVEIEADRWTV